MERSCAMEGGWPQANRLVCGNTYYQQRRATTDNLFIVKPWIKQPSQGDYVMKKLYLSSDKKILGVCGGIGEYFEMDPSIIRLAWIVLTVLTGIFPGIFAYVLAALVIPKNATKSVLGE